MNGRPQAKVRSFARTRWWWLALCALAVAGCTPGGAPQFPLNTEGRDAAKLRRDQIEAIRSSLAKWFGTPDDPRVPEGVDLNLEQLRMAAGPVGGDAQGKQQGLYRRHCVSCHGLPGDGAGPAAAVLNPYPRDFRNGVFKYTSTTAGAKPCRDDLRHVLARGVPGTAMPSHILLAEDEREALVEYVRYLSIRGETELHLFQMVVDEDEYLPLDQDEVLREGILPAARGWRQAEDRRVTPPPRPPIDTLDERAASVARGRELYLSKDAQCVKCHGREGRGDGEETELYDDWNKRKKGVTPADTAKLAPLFTLPIERLRPRNFTEGVFRGGANPDDIYWRIHCGIKGTPMPGVGPAPGNKGVMTPEDIWHLVNYIRSLSP